MCRSTTSAESSSPSVTPQPHLHHQRPQRRRTHRLRQKSLTGIARLRAAGVDVVARLPVTGQVTRENEGYLRTKALRAGHVLDVDALLNSGG